MTGSIVVIMGHSNLGEVVAVDRVRETNFESEMGDKLVLEGKEEVFFV